MVGWPRSLERLIVADEIAVPGAKLSALNQSQWLEQFYQFTSNSRYSSNLPQLAKALKSVVQKRQGSTYVSKRGNSQFRNRMKIGSNYLTKEETKRTLGISSETFFRLVKTGKLEGDCVGEGAHLMHRVTRKSITAYESERRAYISKTQLVDDLGMSRPFVEKIIASAVVQAKEGPAIDGAQQWKFDPKSKLRFLNSIEANYRPLYVPQRMLIGFRQMYEHVVKSGISWEQFLQVTTDGTISPCRVDRAINSLMKFSFCRWDVEYSVKQFKAGSDQQSIPGGSIRFLLGLSPKQFSSFLEMCFEGVTKVTANGPARSFTLSEVRWFAENYVSDRFLSEILVDETGRSVFLSKLRKKDKIEIKTCPEGQLYRAARLTKILS